jgi:hypothetical protein
MSDKDLVISQEIAEEQFELLADYYGIDLSDLDDGDGEVASSSVRNKFLRAVRHGLLEVVDGDNGVEVKQVLIKQIGNIEVLTYSQVNGRARKSLRKIKGHYEQMYTLLGVLSGESAAVYDKMTGKDLSAAESLALLFLIA